MAIQIVRLISSEEIIADVEMNEDNHSIRVSDPLVIHATEDPNTGQVSVGLMPFMMFCKKREFEINYSLVLTMGIPNDHLRDQYRQMHSAIVQPETRQIIT